MEIAHIGTAGALGETGSFKEASALSGSFAGMSVAVQEDAGSALADSAEELTFARDNSKQTKLADRKEKAARESLKAKIEKLLQTVQAASHNDSQAQNRVYKNWRASGRSVQELLSALQKLGGQPASTYGFLLNAAKEETSPELKAQLEAAAQDLFERERRSITASLNALSACESSALGAPLELSETYAALSAKPQEPEDLLAFLQERFNKEDLKAGIELMFKALAADLAAAQSSQEAGILNDIAGRLGRTRVLNASLTLCEGFVQRLGRVLHIKHTLKAQDLLQQTVKLAHARFISPRQAADLYRRASVLPTPEEEVLAAQEFLRLTRSLPEELFSKPEERLKLIEAVQKQVDDAVAKEDEWLETQ